VWRHHSTEGQGAALVNGWHLPFIKSMSSDASCWGWAFPHTCQKVLVLAVVHLRKKESALDSRVWASANLNRALQVWPGWSGCVIQSPQHCLHCFNPDDCSFQRWPSQKFLPTCFIQSHYQEAERLFLLSDETWQACDCFDQKMVEITLCQCWIIFSQLAPSASCLLECWLLGCALWKPSFKIIRVPNHMRNHV
jgi:hypothetical protein